MHACSSRTCFFLSREAVHRHREIVAKRRRGVDAPLSAPRAGVTAMATRDPFVKVHLSQEHPSFSVSQNQNQKGLHRPGIEPGSVPWQGTILPLDHRCLGFIASSAINFSSHDTRLAIFGFIKHSIPRKMSKRFTPRCFTHTTTHTRRRRPRRPYAPPPHQYFHRPPSAFSRSSISRRSIVACVATPRI